MRFDVSYKNISCWPVALRDINTAPQNPRNATKNTTLKRLMSRQMILARVLVYKPVVLKMKVSYKKVLLVKLIKATLNSSFEGSSS